jgi:hypothetical protein
VSKQRECSNCDVHDIWDRALYLDAEGNVTTYYNAVTTMESVICLACKHLQSLGPANDTAPEVAIEKRAAELSRVPAGAFVTSDAQSGWYCNAEDLDPPPWPHCPDAWAGWLAREISEHDASEGEGA